MAKTIYIDLELEKKKIIKQMKDLEKDLAQSIKRTEKNAKFKTDLDSKNTKKKFNDVGKDLIKKAEKINKAIDLSPTIDDKSVNKEFDDVRQNLSDFYKRIDSQDSKSYAKRLSNLKQYKKELNKLKKIAEQTGDVNAVELLGTELELVGKRVTQANAELTNFVKTGENNVSVLGKMFNNVNREIEESRKELKRLGASTKSIDKLEKEVENLNKDFTAGKISAGKYAKGLEKIQRSSQKTLNISRALKKAFSGVVGAVAGFVAFSKAKDYVLGMDTALTKLQISIGATEEEVRKFNASARNIQKSGIGNFDRNIQALSIVKRQLKLTGKEAEKFVRSALLLEDAFGVDVKESIDASDKAMKSFGISGKQANDIILTGLQRSGNASGDFIDTIREYSSQIGEAGGSFQEFVNKILVAEELGIRNSDQFADLYRESIIRVKDASDKTKDSFKELGLNYDTFSKKLADGSVTVEEQIQIIANKILEIKDPLEQDKIAVDLLGTKFEDNGIVIVQALASMEDKLIDFQGATDKAGKIVEESLGGKWAKITGAVGEGYDRVLKPALGGLIDGFYNVSYAIGVGLNRFNEGHEKLIENSAKATRQWALNFGASIHKMVYSGKQQFKDLWTSTKESASEFFDGLISSATNWGGNLITAFSDGITNKLKSLKEAVFSAGKTVKDYLGVESPTKEGPLAVDQSKWGKNLIAAISQGITSEIPGIKQDVTKIAGELSELDRLQLKFTTKASITKQASKLNTKLDTLEFGTDGFNETKKQIRLLGDLEKKYNSEKTSQELALDRIRENHFHYQIKAIEEQAEVQEGLEDNYMESYKRKRKAIEDLSNLELGNGDTLEEKYKEVNEKIIVYKNDLKDITQKILNEEKESIEDLSKSIKKLQDEAKDIVGDKDNAIAERKLDILKRQKEIQKELKALEKDGVNKDFVKNTSREDLEKSVENEVEFIFGGKGVQAKELLEYKKLLEEVIKLENEKKLVDDNINTDVLQEITRQQGLSQTEKILEKYNEEKVAIEDKLTVALQSLSDEGKAYKDLTDIKTEAEKIFTGTIVVETDKRISEQARLLDDARRVAAEMVALGFNGQGFKASFTKKNSDGSTQTVTRTVNITNNNTVKQNVDVRKLSREQAKQIARAEKSGNKF